MPNQKPQSQTQSEAKKSICQTGFNKSNQDQQGKPLEDSSKVSTVDQDQDLDSEQDQQIANS